MKSIIIIGNLCTKGTILNMVKRELLMWYPNSAVLPPPLKLHCDERASAWIPNLGGGRPPVGDLRFWGTIEKRGRYGGPLPSGEGGGRKGACSIQGMKNE